MERYPMFLEFLNEKSIKRGHSFQEKYILSILTEIFKYLLIVFLFTEE